MEGVLSIINWLNYNQGSVMAILTFVYVIATYRILLSNKKSADAAITANKQQLSLQLFERRLESYNTLNKWVNIAKILLIPNPPIGTTLDIFNSLLYNSTTDKDINYINSSLQNIEYCLSRPLSQEKILELKSTHKRLLNERSLKLYATLNVELNLIKQIEILFPNIEFKTIKSFSDSFMNAVIEQDTKNIDDLKQNVRILLDKNVLDTIWNTIKEI